MPDRKEETFLVSLLGGGGGGGRGNGHGVLLCKDLRTKQKQQQKDCAGNGGYTDRSRHNRERHRR